MDIKHYDGHMYLEKINNCLRNNEVYFSYYGFFDKEKIYFSLLKMEGYELLWWEGLF